jgi:DNA helicase-2/ATP-dependent DNA helicase PcrA
LRYPHYVPQGTYRNVINLRYFGDGRQTKESPWHAHRVDLWSSEPGLAEKLKNLGYNPRTRSRNNWRIGLNRLNYEDVQLAAQKLSRDAGNAEIIVGAFLVDRGDSALAPRFSLMPASHLYPSMIVAVEKNGEIVEDIISEVSRESYKGDVFDLEIDNLHNYLAGGVVVHNSIYRWRGADYRNVQRFEQDYPQAQVILLEQNYRSRQTILDAGMAVIDRNPHRRRKRLFTERGTGDKLIYFEAFDDYTEAAFVVDTIASLVASKTCEPGKCAVMYRTNAQSRLLEEAFLQARLPYRLVGAQRFYGRREVKDMIAYLRLVHNPADEISLDRVINTPPRGIGDKTISALHTTASGAGTTPSAVLMDLTRGDASPLWSQFSARAALPLGEFGTFLTNWRIEAPHFTVTEMFDRIVKDIKYQAFLDDGTDEGAERWENVEELRRLTLEYDTRTMTDFLENVALISDQDTLPEGSNAPSLLTLHAAKGLEFDTVFIVGLDDGLLPHSRSFDEPEAMEEERRLFYVGITRAKDRLYLLRALHRGGRGYTEDTLPSRYLEDIPAELLNGGPRVERGRSSRAQTPAWLRPDPVPAAVVETRFRDGMRVKHPQWGEGIVLNSRLQDNDETVDVVFESVGIKRLAASLANLSIIKSKKPTV